MNPNYGGFTPIGGIIIWSGAVANIPSDWALCNGQTLNGVVTPNLIDRFIKASITPGQVGGPSISGSTDSTQLTMANIPRHSHGADGGGIISILGGTNGAGYSNVVVDVGDGWTGAGGDCANGGNCAPGNLNSLGGGQEPSTGHSHSFQNVSSVEPAWYSLAFIMRIA